jgi:hypothetical protein
MLVAGLRRPRRDISSRVGMRAGPRHHLLAEFRHPAIRSQLDRRRDIPPHPRFEL